MLIKILLIVLGIGLFCYGVYLMWRSSEEVVQSNTDVSKMGDELLASNYPLGASIMIGGFIIGLINGLRLRKELSKG